MVLLPGSKSTIADLGFLREQGWDIDITAHLRRGGMVMGLCGGYQMLGRSVDDPQGIEGPTGATTGLGHLAVDTVLAADKTLARVSAGSPLFDATVTGYEIHMGRTEGTDCARPLLDIDGRPDGAISADGLVIGTYVHGIFADDGFRRTFLANLAARRGQSGSFGEVDFAGRVDAALDELATHMAANLDLDAFAEFAGL
jgi:adenosylcobyric acid synthase